MLGFFFDVVFVTVLCSHLNAGRLTSRRKHIPCFRTTLDIPEGCFKGFFFLFLGVLSFKRGRRTDSEALKARKNSIRDSNEGPGGLERGLTIFLLKRKRATRAITYFGRSFKNKVTSLGGSAALIKVRI